MTTTNQILTYLNTLAPKVLALDWDNVGLLCGDKDKPVSRILVALDPFEDVCNEAIDTGAELIVTHHPLIFVAPKSVTTDTSIGKCILLLARHGISAINVHTNLDMAPGGVNDVLAKTLGLADVSPIPYRGSDCHEDGALLRYGTVSPQPLTDFLAIVKEKLGCPGLRYTDCGKPVHRVAVGGGELMDAIDAGCDTFVTSDVRYNQFWDAHDFGLNIIDAGHFYTENPAVKALADKLAAQFPNLSVEISQKHADCMKFF